MNRRRSIAVIYRGTASLGYYAKAGWYRDPVFREPDVQEWRNRHMVLVVDAAWKPLGWLAFRHDLLKQQAWTFQPLATISMRASETMTMEAVFKSVVMRVDFYRRGCVHPHFQQREGVRGVAFEQEQAVLVAEDAADLKNLLGFKPIAHARPVVRAS